MARRQHWRHHRGPQRCMPDAMRPFGQSAGAGGYQPTV